MTSRTGLPSMIARSLRSAMAAERTASDRSEALLEVLDEGEKGGATAAFLKRAVTHFRARGVDVKRMVKLKPTVQACLLAALSTLVLFAVVIDRLSAALALERRRHDGEV